MILEKIKIAIMCMLTVVSLSVAAAAPVYAADSQSKIAACDGLKSLNSDQACTTAGEGPVTKLITAVVTILTYIIGIASIIMIIVGGLKYITSGGDSNSVSSAKNTVLYALIGLVVAVLAQFLVHFVVDKITTG